MPCILALCVIAPSEARAQPTGKQSGLAEVERLLDQASNRHLDQDYPAAERLYRRALMLVERARGLRHPDVAPILRSLGEVHRARGLYAEAEGAYQRALAIDEKELGSEAFLVRATRYRLGLTYLAWGKHAQAERVLQRLLATGPPDDDVAFGSRHALARLHEIRGGYEQAERLYREALALGGATLGVRSPEVARAAADYAALLRKTNRFSDAERFEVERARRGRLAADDGMLAAIRSTIAIYYGFHGATFPPSKEAVTDLMKNQPITFQCPGNDFEYDPSTGATRLVIDDPARC